MKIEIENYVIWGEDVTWIVAEKKIHEKGKNKGETYLDSHVYHGKLYSALFYLRDQLYKNDNKTSIQEVIELVHKTAKQIREAYPYKEGFEKFLKRGHILVEKLEALNKDGELNPKTIEALKKYHTPIS